MVEYVIGRDPDPSHPRIVLEDNSVSRTHGKLSPLGNDKYLLTDLQSRNGTYVKEKGGWRRIESIQIGPLEEIRLGLFATTVAALLKRASFKQERVRMERNPETGEIIKRKAE